MFYGFYFLLWSTAFPGRFILSSAKSVPMPKREDVAGGF
jgi:hypothetical protein